MKPIVALATILLLAGCSSPVTATPTAPSAPASSVTLTTGSPTPTATATQTMSATVTPTPSATATPTPPPTTNLKLGQTARLSDVKVTVSKRKTLYAAGLGTVQAFMVKSCVKAGRDPMKLGLVDWNAVGGGGANYEAIGVSGYPKLSPSYPGQRTVRPGTCVQGWVVFNTKAKLYELLYSNVMDPEGDEASWKIG